MPRQARIDAPGALHHILIRGIERKALFRDQTDRDRFVERLGTVLTDTVTTCYAWARLNLKSKNCKRARIKQSVGLASE